LRKSQLLAAALAVVLTVLACSTWWTEARFEARAARATGTLAGFDDIEVRSLFATETERHPVVAFVDGDGETRRFTVQSTAARVGVEPDAPIGTELAADVLYDPTDPTRARLAVEHPRRGALILLLAAMGLLLAPRALAWAFKDKSSAP
jgi:hypothetical protein